MKKRQMLLAVLFMLALAVAFIPGDVNAAKKKGAKLNKTSATLAPGGTVQLKVNNNKKKVTWKSSKTSVATVNSKGLVTGKKAGSATITAKIGKKNLKCKVAVKNVVKNIPLIGAPINTHKSFVYVLKKDKDDKSPLTLGDFAIIDEAYNDEWLEIEEEFKKKNPDWPGYEFVGEATVSVTAASITYQNFDTTVNGYKGEHRYNVNVTGTYTMPDQLSALLTTKAEWNRIVGGIYIIPKYGVRNDPYQKGVDWMDSGETRVLKDQKIYNKPGDGIIKTVTLDKQAKTFTVSITDVEQDDEATKGRVDLVGYFGNDY